MALRPKITVITVVAAISLISAASLTATTKHQQLTSLSASKTPTHSITHKTHFSAKTNTLRYSIGGRVVVGQPNFQGALSVVFFTDRTILPQVHIAIDGVPMPDGSLAIRASMTELTLTNHIQIVGSVTSYTPYGIRFRAVSRTGFAYYGQINLSVNAISNTFTGQLLLRPLR